MVVQLYPQALGSSGTSGLPIPVPNYVVPWGKGHDTYKQMNGFIYFKLSTPYILAVNLFFYSNQMHKIC